MADERTSMLRGVVKSDVSGLDKPGQGKKCAEKTSTTQPHFAALEIGGNDGIGGMKRCPEENASWFSKLTYTYVDSLMKTGAKKHLEHDDLWDVNRRDEADTVYQRYRQKLHESATPQHKQGSVLRSLISEHGRMTILTAVIKVAHDIVMFAPSYLLEQLLHHVTRGGSRQGAFFWACMLLLSTFIENISINVYFHALYRMSLHIKIAMIQLIYDKSLRITNAVRAEMGTGAISNLQSNDAAKIWSLPMYMHVLWNGPFQILVVMGMLVRLMGWLPAMAGFAVTVVMIPLTTVVGKALAKVRRAMVQQTDARVKLASEIITGIKAIKLYAWEKPYADRLFQQREKELKSIRKTQTLQLVSTSSYQSGPVLVALAAFSVHYLQGRTLTAAIAFPALSLFNLLRFPIIMLPSQIMSFVNARVSLQRIQKYLEADEMVPRNTPNPEHKDNPFAVMVDDEDTAPLLQVKSGRNNSNGSAKLAALDARSPSPDEDYVMVPGSKQVNVSTPGFDTQKSSSLLQQQQVAIRMRNGTFSYEKGKDAVLKDLNVSVKRGQLVMVVGQVGSGKSSLLSALLGEMHRIQGKVDILGSVAYTAQDPWIQNTTLRKNVLMGNDYEHDYYTSVLAACALGPDLEMLQAGDATEIGEKGVNLSGGQKHRVALARAAYADAEVYLLDDPLSAVDAHVGRHLFEKCICGLLAPRTRILVTHQLQFLPAADVVIVMSEGGVKISGTYQELLDKGIDLNQFVKDAHTDDNNDADDADNTDNNKTAKKSSSGNASGSGRSSGDAALGSPSAASTASSGSSSVAGKVIITPLTDLDDPKVREEKARAKRAETLRNLHQYRQDLMKTLEMKEKDGKLTKVEQRAVGQVHKAIYKAYISAWSKVFVLLPLAVVLLAFAERGLQVGQNYVLTFWTNDTHEAVLGNRQSHPKRWLTLYFMLGMLSIGMQFCRGFSSIAGSISASRTLHKSLMDKILRLPMSFYDSQPTGRLLNRMTKDTEAVDVQVSGVVNSALTCAVNAALAIIVVAAVTPTALVAVLPLGYMYYVVQNLYIASSRELKRLDSLAFSPIFQHFGESLTGLITIRAFDKQGQFTSKNQANINHSNRAYWPIQVVNRWLSVRLEMMGAFIVFITAVSVSVVMPSNPGLVGLAITSALNLTGIMNWMVRQVTDLEINMNSVERLVEYLSYDEEAPADVPDNKPPAYWPQQGAIEAKNLTVKYRPELDPVLKGLSFTIRPQEKIGVCGRTGCGKSTLMITLYRLIEPCAGTIYIDGVDIMKLGLRDLRSRLSLVPQDPVIFSGTIRSNLDPFNAVDSDDQIWAALRRAGMEDYVKSLEGGLKASIKEGGSNLSVGQRQLLCMARALLRASRILVLDEATSNVDNATDSLIQNTIRTAFPDCTTLTIAHRLHTIIDSDRILVLDAGQLQELDTPHNLLKRPDSTFRKLVEETSKGGGLNADAVSDALAAAIADTS